MKSNSSHVALGWIDLALVGVVTIWGVNAIVVKLAYAQIEPVAFMALRFIIPLILFALILLFWDRSFTLTRRDWVWLAGAGLVGTTFYQPFYLFGLRYSDASDAALIGATTPAFVAIISGLAGRARLAPRGWVGIATAFAGVLVSLSGNHDFGLETQMLFGYALVLLGNLAMASYIVIAEPLTQHLPPVRVTALSMILGGVPLVLFSAPAVGALDWGAVDWRGWSALIFSSVFAVVVAYIGWNLGVQKIGGARTAIYQNLNPAIAMLAAALMLGEHITLVKVIGTAIILLGVQIVRTAKLTNARSEK
jgi:drug/metabolite transporter (DMT)-like permease